jgi:hypothetical protein
MVAIGSIHWTHLMRPYENLVYLSQCHLKRTLPRTRLKWRVLVGHHHWLID